MAEGIRYNVSHSSERSAMLCPYPPPTLEPNRRTLFRDFINATERDQVPNDLLDLTITESVPDQVKNKRFEYCSVHHACLLRDSIVFEAGSNKPRTLRGQYRGTDDRRILGINLIVPHSSRLGTMLHAAQAGLNGKSMSQGDYMYYVISDWTAPPLGFSELPSMFAMLLLSAAYGGIHLAAWNAIFSSEAEKVLWRSSAILVAGGMVVHIVLYTAFATIRDRDIHDRFYNTTITTSLVILFVEAVLYAFARLFLVVESLIQLRSVPIGVYAAVSPLLPLRS